MAVRISVWWENISARKKDDLLGVCACIEFFWGKKFPLCSFLDLTLIQKKKQLKLASLSKQTLDKFCFKIEIFGPKNTVVSTLPWWMAKAFWQESYSPGAGTIYTYQPNKYHF